MAIQLKNTKIIEEYSRKIEPLDYSLNNKCNAVINKKHNSIDSHTSSSSYESINYERSNSLTPGNSYDNSYSRKNSLAGIDNNLYETRTYHTCKNPKYLDILKNKAKYQVLQKPIYLYKQHVGIINGKRAWNNDKKNASIDAAWSGLKAQQQLQAHKVQNINTKGQRIANKCNYFSTLNKLGREINYHAEDMFFPLETKQERKFRRRGERQRGQTQPLDILPRNLIRSFLPIPSAVSSLVTSSLVFALDGGSQMLADSVQNIIPGPMVNKAPNTKVQVSSETCVKLKQQNKDIDGLSAVFSIILAVKQASIEGKDLNSMQITYKGKQLSWKEAYNTAMVDAVDMMPVNDELIRECKGDIHARTIKIKENILQCIVRNTWAVSGGLLGKSINTASGGVVPRGDLMVRQAVQEIAAGYDWMDAYRYRRGRHIKNPQAIMTNEALEIGLDVLLPNLEPDISDKLIFKHIAAAPNCVKLRQEFSNFNWNDEQAIVQQMYAHKDIAKKCMQKFLFCPIKIQQQVVTHHQARTGTILQNLDFEMAKLESQCATLYARLKAIDADIEKNGSKSKYANEETAQKHKKYSREEILEKIDKNKFYQLYAQHRYGLLKAANNAAEKNNYTKCKKYLDELYVIEMSFKQDEMRILTVLRKKVLDTTISAQLRSPIHTVINNFISTVKGDHNVLKMETLFRFNTFGIYSADPTLDKLDSLGDMRNDFDKHMESIAKEQFNIEHNDHGSYIPVFDQWSHAHISSIIANGVFFGPTIVVSMWQYLEHLNKFGRSLHHEFYIKSLIQKTEHIITQANLEYIALQEKIEIIRQKDPNNINKITNLQNKLQQIQFTLKEMPKVKQALQLTIGNVNELKNILTGPRISSTEKEGQKTKLDLANSMAAMLSGLINMGDNSENNSEINTNTSTSSKYNNTVLQRMTQRFRRDENQEHKKAITIAQKITQDRQSCAKPGILWTRRTLHRIQNSFNPYKDFQYLGEARELLRKEDGLENKFYNSIYSMYSLNDIKTKTMSQILQDMFDKIPPNRIADKLSFLEKIRTLKVSLQDELSKNLNENTFQNINKFIVSMNTFLNIVDGSDFGKNIEHMPTVKKTIKAADGTKVLLDRSNNTHRVQHMQDAMYMDYAAMNSKKTFTKGKIKNIYKKNMLPLGRFVFSELPVFMINMPLTIARHGYSMQRQHHHFKQLQIKRQVVHEEQFKDVIESESELKSSNEKLLTKQGYINDPLREEREIQLNNSMRKGVGSIMLEAERSKLAPSYKKEQLQKIKDYYESNKIDIVMDKLTLLKIDTKTKQLESLEPEIMSISQYKIKKATLKIEIQKLVKSLTGKYHSYYLMQENLQNIDHQTINNITNILMRKESNYAPRYTKEVDQAVLKFRKSLKEKDSVLNRGQDEQEAQDFNSNILQTITV